MILFGRCFQYPRKSVVIPFITTLLLCGCEQSAHDVISRTVGVESTQYRVTVVDLLVNGKRYDGLRVSVGGYLGRDFGSSYPAIYFVPDHLVAEDPSNSISLSNQSSGINRGNVCSLFGAYVNVFGKYHDDVKGIEVTKSVIVRESAYPNALAECEAIEK